jgi:hypothetical protein
VESVGDGLEEINCTSRFTKVGLTPEQYEHMNKAERLQKFRELTELKENESENDKIVKSDNYKAVMNILEKQKEGKDITQEDIAI